MGIPVNIVVPNQPDIKVFYASGAVKVTAFGLIGDDCITFKLVRETSDSPRFTRSGCFTSVPTENEIQYATDYMVGTCKPSMYEGRNTIIIPRGGSYLPVINGSDSDGGLTIQVELVDGDTFTDAEIGIEPCGCPCKETTWTATGETRCKNHVIENKEINDCGDTRWTTTTEVCGYSPSVPFVIEVFDGCCGGNQVGYMYHPDEPRDPAATVAVEGCDGVVWGYIYPTVATGRTLPVGGCGETPIGYAVNQSTTAPSFAQCGGDVIVNVPKTTVENTVNVEPTPVEVIVPEPPRSVLSVGWSGDNLLLTYSDGSNQTIATPVC